MHNCNLDHSRTKYAINGIRAAPIPKGNCVNIPNGARNFGPQISQTTNMRDIQNLLKTLHNS